MTGAPLRVVIADDSPGDRALVRRRLEKEFGQVECEDVLDEEGFARVLERESPDLVITDFRLRWTDGLEILRRVKERWPDVAVVMFTGTGNEEVVAEAMRTGLDDYVVKTAEHFGRLPGAARSALARARARETERDRARAAEELRRAVSRFQLAALATGSAVYEWDLETGNTEWSEGLTSAFGYTLEEAGSSYAWWLERVHPEDRERVDAALRFSKERHEAHELEYRFLAKNGSYRYVTDRDLNVPEVDGPPQRAVGAMIDVTHLKELEEQLLQSQKMEAIGRLAGGVAHDFNNILTAIVGHTSLLLGRLPEGDPRRADAEQVQRAAERAVALTRQLLTFGRRHPAVVETLDLNEALEDVVPMLRQLVGERVEIVVRPEPGLEHVRVDRNQFQQVVMNLVANAAEAMPDGGTITVETANARIRAGKRSPSPAPGQYVLLTVRDTGRGMDAETRAHLFEPFFTTKEMGTGLGLATVYGIVAESGGQIEVESTEGEGATFRVYLPPTAGAAAGAPETRPAELAAGSETVLLVEDEEAVRGLARRVLEDCGYTVLVAEDARKALELERAEDGPIDLVLTDVVMPGRTGPELAQELLQRRPGLKVVLMSGYAQDTFARVGLSDDTPHLEKPFTPAALVRAVRDALDR